MIRLDRRQAIALAAASPLLLAGTASAQHKVRGITVSCPADGHEWGGADMGPTVARLKAQGYNWIAIHPYAGIRQSGQVYEWGRLRFTKPPAYITRPIKEAHDRGLKILMKPHLGYWGSGFSWRGEISFDTEAEWRRFFDDYTRWITKVARASRGADGFVVGTELDKTLHREGDWRKVIAAVRQEYSGPLTLAPNWSDFRRVPFWDAVDVIGVQAYFPLVRSGEPTDRARLNAGWRRWRREIGEHARRHQRPVVFTELGYNTWSGTAAAPWKYDEGGPDARQVQARALGSALEAINHDPNIVGAFLWKCFPGDARPRDFDMEAPHLRPVIRRHWG